MDQGIKREALPEYTPLVEQAQQTGNEGAKPFFKRVEAAYDTAINSLRGVF